jgi:catechol 2,3-dioxygenase-like lactoylglutathione lyase family enzyme
MSALDTFAGVDHVQLPMEPGGSPQARRFYESLLGLREWRDPALDRPGVLRYALGGQRLDLSEGRYSGVAPQSHLAIRARGVDGIARRLRGAGVLVQSAPLATGEDRLFFEDPFGNRIELIEAQALTAGRHDDVTQRALAD